MRGLGEVASAWCCGQLRPGARATNNDVSDAVASSAPDAGDVPTPRTASASDSAPLSHHLGGSSGSSTGASDDRQGRDDLGGGGKAEAEAAREPEPPSLGTVLRDAALGLGSRSTAPWLALQMVSEPAAVPHRGAAEVNVSLSWATATTQGGDRRSEVQPLQEVSIIGVTQAEFEDAAIRVKTMTTKPGNDDLLYLYSLYKQASQGDVSGSRPGAFSVIARAKYDAWAKLQGTSADGTRLQYVQLVDKLLGVVREYRLYVGGSELAAPEQALTGSDDKLQRQVSILSHDEKPSLGVSLQAAAVYGRHLGAWPLVVHGK